MPGALAFHTCFLLACLLGCLLRAMAGPPSTACAHLPSCSTTLRPGAQRLHYRAKQPAQWQVTLVESHQRARRMIERSERSHCHHLSCSLFLFVALVGANMVVMRGSRGDIKGRPGGSEGRPEKTWDRRAERNHNKSHYCFPLLLQQPILIRFQLNPPVNLLIVTVNAFPKKFPPCERSLFNNTFPSLSPLCMPKLNNKLTLEYLQFHYIELRLNISSCQLIVSQTV